MLLVKCCNQARTTEPARFLEVWVGGAFHGTVRLRLSSFAARAILKLIDPSVGAEFRDPKCHETYRYDQAADVLCHFG